MTMITVILCTYNRCQTLSAALRSLAASELPSETPWEVLVVDNNSNDQTHQVVTEYIERFPGRFRYLFEPRQGKSFALNAGVFKSQSEVLAFADDDAEVEPTWLWTLTQPLCEKSWSGAGGRIVPVWPKPLPAWLSTADPHTMGPFVAFDAGAEAGPLTRPPYGANMAFRRDMFEKYGGFRIDLGPRPGSEVRREDIEFAERLLTAGEPLWYEPKAVVYHPVSENRLTRKFVLRWWFWYGYSEVMAADKSPQAGWCFAGLPLRLLRRSIRWTLQSLVSIRPWRRFASMRNVSYLLGTLFAIGQRRWRGEPEPASVIEQRLSES
jgi:glycosyltransferase involved in cell wall biosynthesis